VGSTIAPTSFAPTSSRQATVEAERIVAWLRLPAIGLIALSQSLTHPNPRQTAFFVALGLYSAWSVGVLAWVHVRPVDERFALASTAFDIAAISVLALLSGGAFSHVRLAFFVVPVSVAFRFRPLITSAAVIVTTSAYLAQAFAHPAAAEPEAVRFILTQAGFLAWVGSACVLLSLLLYRRTQLVAQLAADRSRLLADALTAEQRERQALAEALHDDAMQNILAARQELEEAGDAGADPALARADAALADTLTQLRDAVFDLHPYVLDEAGLEAALRSISRRVEARHRVAVTVDLRYPGHHPHDALLFSAVRELLSNVVQHAQATHVTIRLSQTGEDVELTVQDDGRGFPPEELAERLADGHIGLATQRVRVEAAGGHMDVTSEPGTGTRVAIRLPTAG
jgi:two-component system NarL family sensor kinase